MSLTLLPLKSANSSASTVQTTDTKTTAKSTTFKPTVSIYKTPPTTKSIQSLIIDQMKSEMKSMMKETKEQKMGLMIKVIREELPTMIYKHKTPVT